MSCKTSLRFAKELFHLFFYTRARARVCVTPLPSVLRSFHNTRPWEGWEVGDRTGPLLIYTCISGTNAPWTYPAIAQEDPNEAKR